jgi:hypothetical protein
VSRNGLEEPLVSDCGAVQVAGRHDRKLEERGRSPVKYLNVYGIDLLQLLRQDGVVIGVQNLREGKDKVASQSVGDIGGLKNRERPPKLVDAWLFRWIGELDDDLGGLRTLSDT